MKITWSERKPAVGVWSVGSDSGISPKGSFEWRPGHPTHKPLPLITTGATAVTKPPALKFEIKKKTHTFNWCFCFCFVIVSIGVYYRWDNNATKKDMNLIFIFILLS